ncbi:MAG: VanW family protein [Patescibacteria group bacterium]
MNTEQEMRNRVLIGVAFSLATLAGIFIVFGIAFAFAFQNKFYNGLKIGSVSVGGLTYEEGARLVRERADELLSQGLSVSVNGQKSVIPLRTFSASDPDSSRDMIVLNLDEALKKAFAYGRNGGALKRIDQTIRLANRGGLILPSISMSGFSFEDELMARFPESYKPASEPSFVFEQRDNEWTALVAEGTTGFVFDIDKATKELTSAVRQLEIAPIKIAVRNSRPKISKEQTKALIPGALAALNRAPFTLIYEPSHFESYKKTVSAQELSLMLAPKIDGNKPILGLNDKADVVLGELAKIIDTEPQNARFVMENNRVTDFASSVDGRALNTEASKVIFEAALLTTGNDAAITLVVVVKEPEITTAKANRLGIQNMLGVGTSSYKGSPANRIKNIRHGVSKLNGLIIAPDETFSLIAALRPFTLEDGYFPEMVIKGDEIKPEVAGGLCQIGTTTFRAAMNSGLPIVERQNHSLVVNYYNDPSNGKPGTDATIYEPAPDLKFLNDTGHYILFEAKMNEDDKSLKYTFWGTADGRRGSYSPPIVRSWTPAGERRETFTVEIAPGERKCQSAHPGAVTSFVYTIERADRTKTEKTFTSNYRPLPEICLVGATQEEIDAKKAAESSAAPAS